MTPMPKLIKPDSLRRKLEKIGQDYRSTRERDAIYECLTAAYAELWAIRTAKKGLTYKKAFMRSRVAGESKDLEAMVLKLMFGRQLRKGDLYKWKTILRGAWNDQTQPDD